MTLTCPGPSCPMCTGEHCSVCSHSPGAETCTHDSVERHMAMPSIDDDAAGPAESRVPTRPIPPVVGDRIELHVDDRESVASFLRTCASIVESTGGLTVIVQGPVTKPR